MSDKRCHRCFNLTAYCTCEGEAMTNAIKAADIPWPNYDQLEAYIKGPPESRHPSAAPPRHLHAVPDPDDAESGSCE